MIHSPLIGMWSLERAEEEEEGLEGMRAWVKKTIDIKGGNVFPVQNIRIESRSSFIGS